MKPYFLITIDTEGDNLWGKPRTCTTHNSRFLPRFQALCDKFGLKPTYLTCYEMATCKVFQSFGKALLSNRTAEIGMHLHAWNSPPLKPLTADDLYHQPYLIEYPRPLIEEKVAEMTAVLEASFETRPRSHRAGRWGFNSEYAQVLANHGYKVDCTVAPHVSFSVHQTGDPKGAGGPDFRGFPDRAYFLDLQDIRKPGGSDLLEVPMTILSAYPTSDRILSYLGYRSVPRLAFHRVFNGIRPLRPNGSNLAVMLGILKEALARKWAYVEFMLHSSEFMPGGSPNFKTEESIENLYRHIEALFKHAANDFVGATLIEYYEHFKATRAGPLEPVPSR